MIEKSGNSLETVDQARTRTAAGEEVFASPTALFFGILLLLRVQKLIDCLRIMRAGLLYCSADFIDCIYIFYKIICNPAYGLPFFKFYADLFNQSSCISSCFSFCSCFPSDCRHIISFKVLK